MPSEELKGLLTSGGYGLATLGFLIAAYLYRQLDACRRELVETIKADGATQRDLLMQTVPLSTKLTDGVAIIGRSVDTLDRLSDKIRST